MHIITVFCLTAVIDGFFDVVAEFLPLFFFSFSLFYSFARRKDPSQKALFLFSFCHIRVFLLLLSV